MKRSGKDTQEIDTFCESRLNERWSPMSMGAMNQAIEMAEPQTDDISKLSGTQCREIYERSLIDKAKKARVRAQFPDIWRPAAELEGTRIGIHPTTRRFIIRWKRSDGTQHSLRLSAPKAAVLMDPSEFRAISFTRDGLDIVDQAGIAFRTMPNGITAPASIRKEHFLSTEPGQILVDLWKEVMGLRGFETTNTAGAGNKDWGDGKGVDRIRARSKIDRAKQDWPPHPLDANFLWAYF